VTGTRGTPVERVIAALKAHGSRIQPCGAGWKAQCPAPDHDDREPSLSVGQGDKGAVLNCQVGCSTEADILPALGLVAADLFDKPFEHEPEHVIEYRYTDEDGNLLFVKVRRPGKKFLIKRPDGHGGWAWGIGDDTRRVLYHLPEVVSAIHDGRTIW
jgi:hypothetical protein